MGLNLVAIKNATQVDPPCDGDALLEDMPEAELEDMPEDVHNDGDGGCWSGEQIAQTYNIPYSAFNRLRQTLARIAGIAWDPPPPMIELDIPFGPLLAHSDCGGSIAVEDVQQLARDFERYLVEVPTEDAALTYGKIKTLFEKAAAASATVLFA